MCMQRAAAGAMQQQQQLTHIGARESPGVFSSFFFSSCPGRVDAFSRFFLIEPEFLGCLMRYSFVGLGFFSLFVWIYLFSN